MYVCVYIYMCVYVCRCRCMYLCIFVNYVHLFCLYICFDRAGEPIQWTPTRDTYQGTPGTPHLERTDLMMPLTSIKCCFCYTI